VLVKRLQFRRRALPRSIFLGRTAYSITKRITVLRTPRGQAVLEGRETTTNQLHTFFERN
jgi:hypothetical protein